MPLIGFVDDNGVQVTFSECWKRDRFGGFPVVVLYKIYLEYAAENRPDGLSATSILGCARKSYLEKQKDYYENPRYLYARFRGSMVHSILEGTNQLYKPDEIISEKRFFRRVPKTDVILSGKIDNYFIKDGVLEDYKTIDDDKVPKLVAELPEDYIWQANIYAWLLAGEGLPVKKIKITFFSFKSVYTSGEVCLTGAKWTTPKWEQIAECPIYTMPQVESFIYHRVRDITRQEMPPVIALDKRWLCQFCPFAKSVCWPEGVPR